MGRRTWILAVGLLATLPVADAIAWKIAVGRLEAGFDAWAEAARTSHWSVARGKVVASGWPWAATLRIDNVAIEGGNALVPGGASWFAPGLVLRIPLMRPRSMDIEVRGEQRLRSGTTPEVRLTGSRLLAVAGLGSRDEPGDLEILADQPKLTSDGGTLASAERVRLYIEVPSAAGGAEGARAFAFSTEGIVLPSSIRWPLGNTIARLDCDGTMEGPIPPPQAPSAWATAWRDGGGSLQLQNLVLNWGPLSLMAAATLALDDQLQPMGAGTSRVTGYAATLDALANSGALSRSAATAAKAVLSLLAGVPGDGEPQDVDVPLTLQYRTLSMRQVPLLRLPEIEWPGP